MMLERARVSLFAIAMAMAVALPASAQQQPAEPPAPDAPAAPEAPQGPTSGPNSLVVSHTLSNLTTQAVQVAIRADGTELFTGRLEGRSPAAKPDDPSPEIKPILTFAIPEEKTLFWEVLYTAIPEEPTTRRQAEERAARNEAPKFCRQAWTAVIAPGATEPQVVVPVQMVNQYGNCNFTIETTEEAVYDVAVQLAAAP